MSGRFCASQSVAPEPREATMIDLPPDESFAAPSTIAGNPSVVLVLPVRRGSDVRVVHLTVAHPNILSAGCVYLGRVPRALPEPLLMYFAEQIDPIVGLTTGITYVFLEKGSWGDYVPFLVAQGWNDDPSLLPDWVHAQLGEL